MIILKFTLQYYGGVFKEKLMAKNKILVVDDEKKIRDLLLRLFKMNNFETGIASNGNEALEIIKQTENKYQIVLTDIEMPELNGLDFIKAAKEINPELVFIVMTGYGSVDYVIEAMRLGAIGFIKKPLSIVELTSTIQKAETIINARNISVEAYKFINNITKNFEFTTYELHHNIDMLINYLIFELKGSKINRAIVDNATLALYEALTNSIENGNLGLDKSINRDSEIDVFDEFLQRKSDRLKEEQFAKKKIKIEANYYQDKVSFTITDEGKGFEHKKYLANLKENIYSDRLSKGIFLIRSISDKIEFNDKGNQIIIEFNL